MKILSISIFTFRLPLKMAIQVSSEKIDCRVGYMILLRDENGNIGYGEAAPLPGLDKTRPETCLEELKKFAAAAAGKSISLIDWNPRAPFLGLLDLEDDYSPLSLFGIESALLFLLLKQPDFPVKRYFGDLSAGISLPVNGLFFPDESEKSIDEQYALLKMGGYNTIKVKVGRIPEEAEIRQIRLLGEKMEGKIKLRLDGNRSLDHETLDRYSSSLEGLEIEYFEEPMKNSSLYRKVKYNIALDESVADFINDMDMESRRLPGSVKALVLKASWLKGLHGLFRTIDAANSAGRKAVLSSSFNTGAGISALALAGTRLDAELETPHGFDTYRYLESDLLSGKLTLENGTIQIPGSVYFYNDILDMSRLEEVTV
jgi:O-succinylbenzoate synthase